MAAAAVALGLLLTGCTGAPQPTAAPSPTSDPGEGSDAAIDLTGRSEEFEACLTAHRATPLPLDAPYSILGACEVVAMLASGALVDATGDPDVFYATDIDPDTGQVLILVATPTLAAARELLAPYGEAVLITDDESIAIPL